jgi:phosphate transport system permease protein
VLNRPQKLRGAEAALPKIDDQALIRYAKRSDGRFAVIGIAVLLISMVVLLAMIVDFMVDGLTRIDYAFFVNFPRRPEQAGILSAWVGSTW